jgi:hypothetical protein
MNKAGKATGVKSLECDVDFSRFGCNRAHETESKPLIILSHWRFLAQNRSLCCEKAISIFGCFSGRYPVNLTRYFSIPALPAVDRRNLAG